MTEYIIDGITIRISGSLRKYVSIQKQFQKKLDEALDVFAENAKYYDSSLTHMSRLRVFIDGFVEELLGTIVKDYNYFNCTKTDFLSNEGYARIAIVTQEYDDYCKQLEQDKRVTTNIALARAEDEANAQITGLDFGIISNSLAAHLIYIAQNEAEIIKQRRKAEQYYNDAEERIKRQADQKATSESRSYYDRVYVPRMKGAIASAFKGIMVHYLQVLDKAGAISLGEIKDYDYQRSEEILKNISLSNSPKKVIATALQCCPYNKNAHIQAGIYNAQYYDDAIDDTDLECIAVDSGLGDDIVDISYQAAKALGVDDKYLLTPTEPIQDENLEKEYERLTAEGIDVWEDNWKLRATAYLRDAQKLVSSYPDSYVGYGLVAAYTIAARYDDPYGTLWNDVKSNFKKFLSHYKGVEFPKYSFSELFFLIRTCTDDYFYMANRYIESETISTIEDKWKTVAKYKRSLAYACDAVRILIEQCVEQKENNKHLKEETIDSFIAHLKNDLLWYTYSFSLPYAGSYNLPLSERTYEINLFDQLIAEGADDYKYGFFSLHKDDTLQKYGRDICRQEISSEGIRYINKQTAGNTGGCYIATAVYGSYDCPEVWTLRRFRDNTLAETWYGRAFIRVYYKVSPVLVKWFGKTDWFKSICRGKLDVFVEKLNKQGVEDTPYKD